MMKTVDENLSLCSSHGTYGHDIALSRNLLLTEREGGTGEYWLIAVRTK